MFYNVKIIFVLIKKVNYWLSNFIFADLHDIYEIKHSLGVIRISYKL